MFPQLDPAEATYLARLIVSILGILFLLGLVFWMIRRKQKTPNTESLSAIISEGSDSDNSTVAHSEISNRSFVLEQTYRAWKAERLLQSEDGRSLFLRAGVEKSGLRYQLVASSQVQALAILLITLMAEVDPKASSQAEALFAELGMNLSTAFNVFVRQSLRDGGIPFEIKMDQPNKETMAAMLEAERIAKDPNVKHYSDVEEALRELKR